MRLDDRDTATLTMEQFTPADHRRAERLAELLGYAQTAYTTTSALWGLFCLGENPDRNPSHRPTRNGCIIHTRELGLLFVQDVEDLGGVIGRQLDATASPERS
jgi:hypothetical protein